MLTEVIFRVPDENSPDGVMVFNQFSRTVHIVQYLYFQ